jgi:hypothetical protein
LHYNEDASIVGFHFNLMILHPAMTAVKPHAGKE